MNGVPVKLRVFPGFSHRFGPDRAIVLKGIAEYCGNFFGSMQPVPNARPSFWYYWLPVAMLAGFVAGKVYLRWRMTVKTVPDSCPGITTVMVGVAWLLGLAAVAELEFT